MKAVLVPLVFLLGLLGRGIGISRQLCDHKQCFVAVQERYDFEGSQKRCVERGGNLMTVESQDKHKELVRLLRGSTGNYWIGLRLPSDKCPDRASHLRGYRWIIDDKATDFNNWGGFDAGCSAKCVSVGPENNSTWTQTPCDDDDSGGGVRGFICEYPLVEPCAPLVLEESEYAEYTELNTGSGFEASPAYPMGTTAVRKPSGAKHICFSAQWLRAPWSCEVLNGGCEQACRTDHLTHSCACPSGGALRADNVTCAAEEDPCAGCAHHCPKEGDSHACGCFEGYELAKDGKGCVDVDECLDRDTCAGGKESQSRLECVNTEGGHRCVCPDGFVLEDDGQCVSVEICDKCEHMDCARGADGAYRCGCRSGFVVWDKDPTKCLQHCDRRDCPAKCVTLDDPAAQEPQCYCPEGYIQDVRNGTSVCTDIDECSQAQQCDHTCRNTYGGYTCSCDEGFDLYDEYQCIQADDYGSGGSTSSSSSTTPRQVSTPQVVSSPTAVPAYVKAGSVLGIAAFVALLAGLLYLVARRALRRCRTFEIASLRPADVDIFYLQQVTTEKYKRFSFDRQWKHDPQRQ